MFGKDKENRFVEVESYGTISEKFNIVVDLVTGVNYIKLSSSYGASITPLLDSDGKVVVSSQSEINELKYRD